MGNTNKDDSPDCRNRLPEKRLLESRSIFHAELKRRHRASETHLPESIPRIGDQSSSDQPAHAVRQQSHILKGPVSSIGIEFFSHLPKLSSQNPSRIQRGSRGIVEKMPDLVATPNRIDTSQLVGQFGPGERRVEQTVDHDQGFFPRVIRLHQVELGIPRRRRRQEVRDFGFLEPLRFLEQRRNNQQPAVRPFRKLRLHRSRARIAVRSRLAGLRDFSFRDESRP